MKQYYRYVVFPSPNINNIIRKIAGHNINKYIDEINENCSNELKKNTFEFNAIWKRVERLFKQKKLN